MPVQYSKPVAGLSAIRSPAFHELFGEYDEERLVHHLTKEEMRAILDAPDPTKRRGLRDQAMLYLGFAAGLRVSELVGASRSGRRRRGPCARGWPCVVRPRSPKCS